MEMSVSIYSNAAGIAECGCDHGENPYEDASEILRIYGNGNHRKLESSGRCTAERRFCRPTVVCIVLLGVLLLVAVTVLWIKSNNEAAENNRPESQYQDNTWQAERDQWQERHSNLSTENDQLQTRYNNLTGEKNQLQTSYNNLTVEKDQLQTSYDNLTGEKDQLQTSYDILTGEKNKLQTSYDNLTGEKDQLQTSYDILTGEKDQLQTSYDNLTGEKDQLQTSYDNLTGEKKQLQTSYDNLLEEQNQLQTSYNNLTVEKNQLQTSYNDLSVEKNQLQARYNNLTVEKNQLQTSYNNLLEEWNQLLNRSYPGWRNFRFRLYYFSTEKKNWHESRKDCRGRGADLVIINSQEEQIFLNKNMDKKNMDAWIGMSDLETEGQWRWVDGTKPTIDFWRPGEPNNTGEEDCVEIYGSPADKGWNDGLCSAKKPYICEKSN